MFVSRLLTYGLTYLYKFITLLILSEKENY